MTEPTAMIRCRDLAKTFVLHTQGGTELPVFGALHLEIAAGECVALHGPSGSGKSTLLRALYANYKPSQGSIEVRHDRDWVDLTQASPRTVMQVRRRTLGYVSQFLHVIPRVTTLEIVAEPAIAAGTGRDAALDRSRALLARLNIPERLWSLAPATFSGGEQQRVNVARGFVHDFPVLLLDEPTASLDAANREVVVELIREAKARGAAIAGIFHDAQVRERIVDRLFEVERFKTAA